MKRLIKSLQSITSQKNYDFSKIEVIIVDDCSDINSINWDELKNKYSFLNINYIRCSQNRGPGVARQTALNVALGKFIFFLDCGDTLYDDSVLNTFSNFNNQNYDIICTKIYDEEIGSKRRSFLFNNAYIFGIFINSDFIKKNNIKFSNVLRWEEDTFFENLLRYYKPKVTATRTIGYTYSNDGDSITRKNNHEYQNELTGFSAMIVKSLLLCEFYKKNRDYHIDGTNITIGELLNLDKNVNLNKH